MKYFLFLFFSTIIFISNPYNAASKENKDTYKKKKLKLVQTGKINIYADFMDIAANTGKGYQTTGRRITIYYIQKGDSGEIALLSHSSLLERISDNPEAVRILKKDKSKKWGCVFSYGCLAFVTGAILMMPFKEFSTHLTYKGLTRLVAGLGLALAGIASYVTARTINVKSYKYIILALEKYNNAKIWREESDRIY